MQEEAASIPDLLKLLVFVSTYWHINRQSNQSTPATHAHAWDNNHTFVCTFNTYVKSYDGHAYVPQLLGNTKIYVTELPLTMVEPVTLLTALTVIL